MSVGDGRTAAAEAPVADGRLAVRTVTVLVRDAATRNAIPDAHVVARDRQGSTDPQGGLRIDLSASPTRLAVTAPGYQDASVDVSADAETVEILLTARARFSEQLEVTADDAADQPAVLPVRPRQVLMVAGAADNVFRVLQTLPGVAATEEFGSRLSVRGGTPDQNLTVMDGVEIHNPYRLFGLTSAFNPETVERFQLTAGGFPARYGDRLSSLLIVDNRPGATDRGFGGSSALSLSDANVIVEGKLPKGAPGSWLLTGRRTYYDVVAERFVDEDLPSFADVQGSARWEMGPGHWLAVSGIRSRESTDASFEDEQAGDRGDFITSARNDLASARFHALLGSRFTSDTVLAWYRNVDALDVDAEFATESRRTNAPGDGAFGLANVIFDREVSVRDLSLRQDTALVRGRHALEAGFELHRLSTGVGFVIQGDRNPNESNGSSVRGGAGLPDALDSEVASTRGGAWLQDRIQAARDLTFEPGLRLDWSDVTHRATLSPRLAASLRLDAWTRLRVAGGLYTQSPGYEKLLVSDYLIDLTQTPSIELESERSIHAVAGIERDLRVGLTLRVEGYYKKFDRLIVGALESDLEREDRLAGYDFPAELQSSLPVERLVTSRPTSDGRGRAYGFDVYVTRAPSAQARFSGWASYTWGRATRDTYGLTYPFEYDRRHAATAVVAWRPADRFDLSVTGRFASGFPRTPVLGVRVAATEDRRDLDQDGDREELIPERDGRGRPFWEVDLGGVSNFNRARLPAFARVDLRATWRPRGAAGRWQLYLDVINLLNRENAGLLDPRLEYDPDGDRPRVTYERSSGIPFLPSLGVRFRF